LTVLPNFLFASMSLFHYVPYAPTRIRLNFAPLDLLNFSGDALKKLYEAVESGGDVKMTKQETIEMIHPAGFEAVERDTVYNRVTTV
jgi:hypothetical protein